MQKLELFFDRGDTSLVVVRFRSRGTALLAIDPSAVYLLKLSPTREDAKRAETLLEEGKLSIWEAHGIFPLTRVDCMNYTVLGHSS